MKGIEIWYNSKEEWLTDRENHLGTTDGICIIGENKYRTPLDVYNERLGLAPKFEGNRKSRMGSRMEAPILLESAYELGAEIEYINLDDTKILGYRHPDYDFIQSSPDGIFIVNGRRRMIECKTTSSYVVDVEIDMPSWIIQANTNAIMAGCDEFQIVYMCSLLGFEIQYSAVFEVDYDAYQVFINAMVEFWAALENRVPPKPTTKKDIENYYRSIDDLCITVTPSQESNFVLYTKYQEVEKEAEKMKEYYKGQLAVFMQSAEYLISTDGRKLLSYKTSFRNDIDKKRLKEEYPEIAKELAKETPIRTMKVANAEKSKTKK